jgi:hypothetical protein
MDPGPRCLEGGLVARAVSTRKPSDARYSDRRVTIGRSSSTSKVVRCCMGNGWSVGTSKKIARESLISLHFGGKAL